MSVTTLSRASGISSVDIKELLKLIPMLSEGILFIMSKMEMEV